MQLTAQVIMDTCQDTGQLASLRNLALGAEALNPATLAQAQRMIPHAVVYNCYGEHPQIPCSRAPMGNDLYIPCPCLFQTYG